MTITSVKISGFSPDLVCALIFWRVGLGMQNGQISSIFDRVICPSPFVFLFTDDH